MKTGELDIGVIGRTEKLTAPFQTLFWLVILAKETQRAFRISSNSHHYGMVGFIKELVDEQGAKDLTRARVTGTATRGSKFENLTITPSIVFFKKRPK